MYRGAASFPALALKKRESLARQRRVEVVRIMGLSFRHAEAERTDAAKGHEIRARLAVLRDHDFHGCGHFLDNSRQVRPCFMDVYSVHIDFVQWS